jgi:hypothetical protein
VLVGFARRYIEFTRDLFKGPSFDRVQDDASFDEWFELMDAKSNLVVWKAIHKAFPFAEGFTGR